MAAKLIDFKRNGSHQSSFTTDRLPSNAGESGMEADEGRAVIPGATQAVKR